MLFQLKHLIYLTFAVLTTMTTAQTIPVSTRTITRIGIKENVDLAMSTQYFTDHTIALAKNETKRLIANMCGQFKGHPITTSLSLESNPSWDPDMGVVYYYIVDDPKKTEQKALCSNTQKGTVPAGPYCKIGVLPTSSKALYVVTHAGSQNVAFDILMTAKPSTKDYVKEMTSRKINVASNGSLHLKNLADEYLTESITSDIQHIDYKVSPILNVTFCPKPQTGKYKISSFVSSTSDPRSSIFTQYICNKLPCEIDGPNVIAKNSVPTEYNQVVLGPESTRELQLYVRIECLSGFPDPGEPSGMACEFVYDADIISF